ncbi:MAG TPA: protein kinase [Desulfuromonadales bacterium]|nr:protein kinase [Desulfuromonadales bacterium]
MTSEPGQQLGQYLIRETLGTGKATLTCRAEDPARQRDVVLKILAAELASDAEHCKKFEQQAMELSALDHPGLAAVLTAQNEDGTVFYAREFIDGDNLRTRLRQGVTPADALLIARQLAEALDVAHAAGHVHRAIKPENILFRGDGRAALADFGLAGTLDADPKLGLDPHYVSPEQARGEQAGPRSDFYSLGVVLYELLTGEVPYRADSDFRIAMLHIHGPLPKLPAPLSDYQGLLDTLLAKKTAERFADSATLIETLDALPAPPADLPPAVAADSHPTEPNMSTDPPAGNEPLPPAEPPVWAEIAALAEEKTSADDHHQAAPEPATVEATDAAGGWGAIEAAASQPPVAEDQPGASSPPPPPKKPASSPPGPKDPLLLWMSVAAIVGAIVIVIGYVFWHPGATAKATSVSSADQQISQKLASADHLIQQGHFDAAKKVFLDLLKTYPKRPEPYNNLAALYARQGELDAAKSTLEKGIQTSPVYGTLYQNLGVIYAQIARNSYGKALQLGTKPTIPHLTLLNPLSSMTSAPAAPTATTKATPPAVARKPAPKAAAATAAQKPAAVAAAKKAPAQAKVAKTAAPHPAAPLPAQPAAATSASATAPPPQLREPAISESQAIQDTVLAWAQAWSASDYPAYASFYANSYQPKAGRSRAQWENLRRRRLERPKWIKVKLRGIRIKPLGNDKATVTFVQSYASNLFHDISHKSLDVVKINGQWRIAAEHSLGATQ